MHATLSPTDGVMYFEELADETVGRAVREPMQPPYDPPGGDLRWISTAAAAWDRQAPATSSTAASRQMR